MLKTLQNFYKAVVTTGLETGTGTCYVSVLPTPSTGYLVINPSNVTKREIVAYSGTGTDEGGSYVTLTTRGVGGTTEQAHDVNEPVRLNLTAEYYAEVQDEVDDLQGQIDTLVLQNAPNASTTTRGIVLMATAPAEAGTAIVVGTNDPRLPPSAPNDLYLEKTGVIKMYGGASAPTGYLLCDNSAVSRTTYSALFAVIGTTYGSGDGSSTFNVPDLRARFPLGYSASAPTKVFTFVSRSSNTITISGASNSANNELQTGQAVLYSAPSGEMTGLTHNTTYYVIRVAYNQFTLASSVANANAGAVISLSSDGTGAQTFTATYTARAMGEQGGEENHALTDAEMPSHTHTISLGNSSGPVTRPGQATDTNPPDTTVLSESAGSDAVHNTMPLFTVVNYIIKT